MAFIRYLPRMLSLDSFLIKTDIRQKDQKEKSVNMRQVQSVHIRCRFLEKIIQFIGSY